jgi:hypothetical protein
VGTDTHARTRSRFYDNIKVDVREMGSVAVRINGDKNME